MSDNEFWVAVWKLIAGCVCFFILVVGGCEMRETQILSEAADPIAIACAKSPSNSVSHKCMAIMQRGTK